MAGLLTTWGILAFFIGCLFVAVAKSAIHEIEAGIAFLVATVAIGAGCITQAVQKLQQGERQGNISTALRQGTNVPEDQQDQMTRKFVESYKK